MLVENGHEQNYLHFIVKENTHQVPETENTDTTMVKLSLIPTTGPKIRK